MYNNPNLSLPNGFQNFPPFGQAASHPQASHTSNMNNYLNPNQSACLLNGLPGFPVNTNFYSSYNSQLNQSSDVNANCSSVFQQYSWLKTTNQDFWSGPNKESGEFHSSHLFPSLLECTDFLLRKS